jgi:hypothetical protein
VRALPEPTSTHPGTAERVAVYAARYAAGLALHAPGDRRADTGPGVPGRLSYTEKTGRHHRKAPPPPLEGRRVGSPGLPLARCRRCGQCKPVHPSGCCVGCVNTGRKRERLG